MQTYFTIQFSLLSRKFVIMIFDKVKFLPKSIILICRFCEINFPGPFYDDVIFRNNSCWNLLAVKSSLKLTHESCPTAWGITNVEFRRFFICKTRWFKWEIIMQATQNLNFQRTARHKNYAKSAPWHFHCIYF